MAITFTKVEQSRFDTMMLDELLADFYQSQRQFYGNKLLTPCAMDVAADEQTYFINQDDEVVGFFTILEGHKTHLRYLFINTVFQNNGIGEQVINKLLEQYDTLYLSYHLNNTKAINFYKRFNPTHITLNNNQYRIRIDTTK